MSPLDDLIASVRLLAASQVLLFVAALLVAKPPAPARWSGTFLGISVLAYLVIGLPSQWPEPARHVLELVASAIPPLLVIFVWTLFDDHRRLPMGLKASSIAYLLAVVATLPPGAPDALRLLLQLAKLGFATWAIQLLWRGRGNDLVEGRLRLRRAFAAGIASMVIVVVAAELLFARQVPDALELLGMVLILALALASNLAFLRLNPAFTAPAGPGAPPAKAPDPLRDTLAKLMQEQRLYAEHTLRIASLAARLRVPEYRLRRTINRDLGYRNFNQFVNDYRIAEAAQRLRDEPRQPILSIALDVGFKSVSAFNQAFHDRHGIPPSAYRSDHPPEA